MSLNVITFIGGVSPKTGEAVEGLVQHLETLNGYSPEMLVIAEQNSQWGLETVKKHGGTWRRYDCSTMFNMSRAINVGIRACDGLIWESPTDLRYDADYIKRIYAAWEQSGRSGMALMGSDVRMQMFPDGSEKFVPPSPFKEHVHLHIRLYARYLAELVNGYDETYIGWSAMDREFAIRARRVGAVEVIDRNLIHWHLEHPKNPAWRDQELMQKMYRKFCVLADSPYQVQANVGVQWGQFDEEEIHL